MCKNTNLETSTSQDISYSWIVTHTVLLRHESWDRYVARIIIYDKKPDFQVWLNSTIVHLGFRDKKSNEIVMDTFLTVLSSEYRSM